MGSFSWNKADDLTKVENIAYDKPFKFLIPKEFGGGFIKDYYQDYGSLTNGNKTYDMYELLAIWNEPSKVKFNGEYNPLKEIDEHTDFNRCLGIDIGCYDEDIDKLKYPLKLVSVSFKETYEDLDKPSYGDPDQGFGERKRDSLNLDFER